ncbi:MAG TPA: G5 domain-containing protein [Candidatus Saccharimonadales bacterium]|nr:G5 domain-containing protein [Candidatus Saccharimonadales bacterium]
MRKISRKPAKFYGMLVALLSLFFISFGIITITAQADAQSLETAPGERLITVHDNGKEKGILTRAATLRQAFEEAHVRVDPNDMIEPGLDEKLVASSYDVNIYRARPVTVVDGAVRQRVMSPHQTAKQIAYHAGIELRHEDIAELSANNDIVGEGAGMELTITRATDFTFVLYGKVTTAYTQAKTVGEMLKEKNITMGPNDALSIPVVTPITKGMIIELWRNGKQTITEEQAVPFDTEKIQDMDREVGYREVKTAGEPGMRTVTYEIEMQNGKEISRKEIQSIVTKEPKKQVETIGAKPKAPVNPSEAAQLGHEMMLAYGFGEDQWSCLYNLWMRESGWRTTAGNPSSGAYGIPQALPGSKMGPGWQTDARVQIQWGLGYVKGRYGTPCGAWSAFLSKGWY